MKKPNKPILQCDKPNLTIVTTTVTGNEPCLYLQEVHKNSPKGHGPYRYQVLKVVRNDKIAEYSKNMGLASKYEGIGQFQVYGGGIDEKTGRLFIEETVDSMKDIANGLRETPPFDRQDRFEERRVV